MIEIKVVDSLVEITSNDDISLLAQSLVNTINELYPHIDLRLFNIKAIESNISIHLIACSDHTTKSIQKNSINKTWKKLLHAMFKEVMAANEIIHFSSDITQKEHALYPVINEKNEILAILLSSAHKIKKGEEEVISGILKVYSNYLNILNRTQRDKLTGLFNRETLDQQIIQVLQSSLPEQVQSSEGYLEANRRVDKHKKSFLGIIDIDHFKNINDNFGHLYGDEILVLIARFMTIHFTRFNDLVFRYGGEEFVIIVKADDIDNAYAAFERLRENIANHSFPQVGTVTVSIGFVEISNQTSPQEVISLADQALYFVKDNGRNDTKNYHHLLEEGRIQQAVIHESEDPILF